MSSLASEAVKGQNGINRYTAHWRVDFEIAVNYWSLSKITDFEP
jgi:hypothetical protein